MKTEQYQGFEYPKSNIQEVLLTLITQGYVSLFDFPVMAGFRTRVSNLVLEHNLKLETTMDERHNKFGNKYRYAIHKLPKEHLEYATNLYKKMTSNERKAN